MDRETELLINDLWLALSMYVDGYPFDEDHREKHRELILRAQRAIGIPDDIEDYLKIVLRRLKEGA